LSFKVPSEAPTGYLFYWGLYWGPFDLAKGGGKSPPT